jgi:hypothetical protein
VLLLLFLQRSGGEVVELVAPGQGVEMPRLPCPFQVCSPRARWFDGLMNRMAMHCGTQCPPVICGMLGVVDLVEDRSVDVLTARVGTLYRHRLD